MGAHSRARRLCHAISAPIISWWALTLSFIPVARKKRGEKSQFKNSELLTINKERNMIKMTPRWCRQRSRQAGTLGGSVLLSSARKPFVKKGLTHPGIFLGLWLRLFRELRLHKGITNRLGSCSHSLTEFDLGLQ